MKSLGIVSLETHDSEIFGKGTHSIINQAQHSKRLIDRHILNILHHLDATKYKLLHIFYVLRTHQDDLVKVRTPPRNISLIKKP